MLHSFYQTCCELLGTHYASEFFITTRDEVITVCFNIEEEVSISTGSTTWYLFKTFVHTCILCSCFVSMVSSHKIAVVLSVPPWRTLITRRDHYLVSTSINLAKCTRNITIVNMIDWTTGMHLILCSI